MNVGKKCIKKDKSKGVEIEVLGDAGRILMCSRFCTWVDLLAGGFSVHVLHCGPSIKICMSQHRLK